MKKNNFSKEIYFKVNNLVFKELRELIDNCIRMERHNVSQENLSLFTTNPDLLDEYINILKTKVISKPIKPFFSNTFGYRDLQSLYNRLEKLKLKLISVNKELKQGYDLLESATRNQSNLIKDHQLKVELQQKQIEKLKQEIKECEEDISNAVKVKEENLKKYNNYRKEALEYKVKLRRYQTHCRILERIQRDRQDINHSELRLIKLNWKILPKGEETFQELRKYLSAYLEKSGNEVDEERINKLKSLEPDTVYCGNAEFEGYLVFYFENKKIAILDCPQKGNAIYILGEDWKKLSQLTKSELLKHHKTHRIIHKGDWFEKLILFLKRGYYSRYL